MLVLAAQFRAFRIYDLSLNIPVTWLLEALLEALKFIHGSLGLILKFMLELGDPDYVNDRARNAEERKEPPDKRHGYR